MMYWWMWLIMIIFWIIIISLIVWAVVFFTRRVGPGGSYESSSRAVNIARDRYARGEISKEEFERIKAGLQ